MTSDELASARYDASMKNNARSYKDLVAWQKAIALAKLIYNLTKKYPAEEKFGLVAQMRRVAVSIPSNIAEGQAQHTTGEFIQFVSHAEGSVAELDTQLILSIELELCNAWDAEAVFSLITEARKMLNALGRKLSARE